MADMTFNTTAGNTIERELMIAYLNTGTSGSPTWSPLGARVEDGSIDYDWSDEVSTDILGIKRGYMKKPTLTQTFDPSKLDSADAALVKIWNLAVKDQDYAALANMDVLVVHFYTSTSNFAERYSSCMVRPTSLGGEGGGDLSMPIDVTFGGTRTVGSATKGSSGAITFTAAA